LFFFPDELNSILFLFLNDVYLIGLGFLLPNVVGTVRNQFGFFTSEAGLVEGFAFTARNQARETVDASDETAAVAGDGETGVGPELGGGAVGGYFGGALEAHHGFRIADFQQKIRPVASMDAVVVHQSGFALLRQRLSMDALDVVGRTLGAFWVESELVLAPGGTDRGH
jgi:hypothetical protein